MATKTSAHRAEKAADALTAAATAHKRGDRVTAKRLYRKVLKSQPHHPQALRLAALLAHESGELDEAVRLLGVAVRHARPGDTGPLEDLGLIHLQTGGQEKAESLLRRAVSINATSLPALTRLGSTLITCGRGSEAAEVLRRARQIDGTDPQLGYSLAHALLEAGEFEAAITVSDETLALKPGDPPTLVVKGVSLYQLERLDEAETVLAQSVALDSTDVNGLIHLGRARLKRNDHQGAIRAFQMAVDLSPELATVRSQLANAHSAMGSPETAMEICDRFLDRHPTSAALILVKALALRDAGRREEADELLGLDALVLTRQIKPPARYGSLAAFNAALEKMIRSHPSLALTHTNRATRHGIQTGSLVVDPPPDMRALLSVIDAQVRATQRQLRETGLGSHPWVRHAPRRWMVNSWAVVLSDRGHQLSHIHPEAWMSGVYYVALPQDGMGPGHGENGWIELGRPTDQLFVKEQPRVRSIEPKPGLMVTFPSYTFHRTIPFQGRHDRISIAFDVFALPQQG